MGLMHLEFMQAGDKLLIESTHMIRACGLMSGLVSFPILIVSPEADMKTCAHIRENSE